MSFEPPVTNLALETGGNLAAVKADLDTVAGTVSAGKVQTVVTNASLPVTAAALPLPAGASQDGTDASGVSVPAGGAGIRGWLSGIYAKLSGALAVTGTFWQSVQPVSGTVSANSGTDLNTSLLSLESGGNLAAIKADTDRIPFPGQALAGASVPVVLPAAQIASLTPAAALTNFSLETGGNLAAVKADLDTLAGAVSAGKVQIHVADASVPVTGTFYQATQPVSGTVAANAGTNLNTSLLALETGGNLAAVASKLPAQGQALAAGSLPVVLTASQITTLTPTAAITNFSVESGGNLAGIKADTDTIAGTVSAGKVQTNVTNASLAVTGTFFQATQPVSGTVTSNAGTNLNTSLLALETGGNLAAIKTDVDKIPAQGQALSGASMPVVLPAAQITTLTPPASVGLNAGTALVGKVGIDQTTPGTTNKVAIGTDGTVAINTALPAGTNIIGKVTTDQTTHGTTDLVAADITKVAGSAISQGHGTAATAIRVELPTDGTGAVVANAGTNLNTSLLALETGGNLASLSSKTPALGQALATASVPVVMTAAQITTLTPPAAITNFAQETGGNLAAIKADTDKIPAQGQALAGSSMPVVMTAAQITTLTPLTAVGLNAGTALIGKIGIDQTTPGTTNAVVATGSAASGSNVSGNPVYLGAQGRSTLQSNVTNGQAVGVAADRYGRLQTVVPNVTILSSAATPITTNTNTSIITAPAAGFHLKIYRIFAQNSAATGTWMYWTEASGGTKKFPMYLTQYQSMAFNLEGSWELPSATALYINTATTGANIEWQVGYETVAD